MTKSAGLKFEKFDLHVHTPGSFDFLDKNITPKDIVSEALSKGLKAIAITDHNAGSWVDLVIEAAKGSGLTVFPGVEIYCSGGDRGIHVIAIFDVNKNSKHILGLLGALNINADDFGKKTAVSNKSVYDVIDIITKSPSNAIAILAHCTSSKGVLSDIKGETRKEIFKHPGILAVESSINDFTDPDKISKKTRAIDLLNGTDGNFNNRKLGVYIASDSHEPGKEGHSLKGIGSVYTFFKVDEVINLESLRQCLIDRDVRIRQHFDYTSYSYPRIINIFIKGGFFDNQNACFHEGLNSIIGSKGSGKSLLIELMRFALNKASSQSEILSDFNGKLDKKLQTYGTVEITFIDETGTNHKIERLYNPTGGNPYKEIGQESVANSLNIIFLSQNEIIKIAENESEQIKFIDSFFDSQYYKNRIANAEKDISIFDDLISDGIKAYIESNEILAQLENLNQEKLKLDKILSDAIYDKYKTLEEKDKAILTQETYLEELLIELTDFLKTIEGKTTPDFQSTLQKDDPIVKRNSDVITGALSECKTGISQTIEKVKALKQIVTAERTTWSKVFQSSKEEYETHIRTTGGDRKIQEAKRLKIANEIGDLTKRYLTLKKKKENLKNIIADRDKKIDELFAIYTSYSDERKSKCQKFEKESNEKLKIIIKESSNFDEFKEKLHQLKKGSYIQNVDIETICSKITPKEFISKLLNYEISKKDDELSQIVSMTGITIDKIKILSDFLLSQVDYSGLLKLQYKAKPQDQPEIQFKVNNTDYELIKNISVGQKCTAMLIMTLSDGSFPIVIDQPEDSLDVRTVWDDMCTKVRSGKEKRQFIFTTHNSSLAVASDTDKFIIIESDATSGKVVNSGALDSADIKEEVITYLEGGRPTYTQKASKYDII